MSASSQCPHSDNYAKVSVANISDSNIHYAEVEITCNICGAKARFRGMPIGCTPAHPTMALDGSNVNLPFTFGDEEYDGKAIGIVGTVVDRSEDS